MAAPSANAHARLASLYQELAGVHERLARDKGDEYVDQYTSPLGTRLHCRLVRCGTLVGFSAGRRVLVRRADLDEYLEQHRIVPRDEARAPDPDEALLAKVGGRVA